MTETYNLCDHTKKRELYEGGNPISPEAKALNCYGLEYMTLYDWLALLEFQRMHTCNDNKQQISLALKVARNVLKCCADELDKYKDCKSASLHLKRALVALELQGGIE